MARPRYPHPDANQAEIVLKGGEEQYNHDDWSCLEDAAAEGLIRLSWSPYTRQRMFDCAVGKVKFTEKGRAIADQLRQHKAGSGNWATFSVQVPLERQL